MNYLSFRKFLKTLQSIGFLTIVLTAALLVNWGYAAWSEPTAAPTGGNVDLPLNVGAVDQTKIGLLDLDGLKLTSGNPRIYLHDTTDGEDDIQLQSWDNRFRVLHNISDDPTAPVWNIAMVLKNNEGSGRPNYAKFDNQVRAEAYCDATGNNCFTSGTVLPSCASGETLVADSAGVWQCAAGPVVTPTTNYLHASQHTEPQCRALGGTPRTVEGSVKVCNFPNTPSCPVGWAGYKDWSTTQNVVVPQCSTAPRNTGSHGWSNTPIESSIYTDVVWIFNADGSSDNMCQFAGVTYATVLEKACY